VNATPKAASPSVVDLSDLVVARNGNLYLSYATCALMGYVCSGLTTDLMLVGSTDGGLTWSMPKKIASIRLPPQSEDAFGTLPGTTATLSPTPALAIDTSSGPNRNRLYVALSSYVDGRLQVLLSSSDDRGRHWSPPTAVAAGPTGADQFAAAVSVNKEGIVAVTWMDQRRNPELADYRPMVAFSSDGGASFGPAMALNASSSVPRNRQDLGDIGSHVWAGSRLKAAFIGANRNAKDTLRLTTARP
jgi:hypothetical protein